MDTYFYNKVIRYGGIACYSMFPLIASQSSKLSDSMRFSYEQELIIFAACIGFLLHTPLWIRTFVLQTRWHSLTIEHRHKLSLDIFYLGMILMPLDYIIAGSLFSIIKAQVFERLHSNASAYAIAIAILNTFVLIQASANAVSTSLKWLLSLAAQINIADTQNTRVNKRIIITAIAVINTMLIIGSISNVILTWKSCSSVGNMIQLGLNVSNVAIFNIFLLDCRKIAIPQFSSLTDSSLIETLGILKEMMAYLITYTFILALEGGTVTLGCSSFEPSIFVSLLLICWPTGAVLLLSLFTLFRYYYIQRNAEMERLKNTAHAAELESRIMPTVMDLEMQNSLDENCCAICLEEYHVSDEIYAMKSCKHVYHFKCVKYWFGQARDTCPTCRTRVDL